MREDETLKFISDKPPKKEMKEEEEIFPSAIKTNTFRSWAPPPPPDDATKYFVVPSLEYSVVDPEKQGRDIAEVKRFAARVALPEWPVYLIRGIGAAAIFVLTFIVVGSLLT